MTTVQDVQLFDDGYGPPPARLVGRVEAAQHWVDNGALIADLARVGHLDTEGLTLDCTYGPGVFWSRWRPRRLIIADLEPLPGVQVRADCRWLPFPDGVFDQVVFDPPYVAPGGRDTAGMKTMYGRYGQLAAPADPSGVQDLIYDTLPELHRVLRLAGVLLVKCSNYVSSGRKWPGTHRTLWAAIEAGFEFVDEALFVGSARCQPHGTQHHLASNYSVMLVLQKRIVR